MKNSIKRRLCKVRRRHLYSVISVVGKVNRPIKHVLLAGCIELAEEFDAVLGLGVREFGSEEIPEEIRKLAEQREQLRKEKKFAESDKLRDEIKSKGYPLNGRRTRRGDTLARTHAFFPLAPGVPVGVLGAGS